MRRSRLPRIQLKALKEPDFVEIGLNNAAQDGRRGPPSGRGLAASRAKEALSCAVMPASGRIRASSTSCVQSVRPRDGGSLEVRTWWTRPDSTEGGLRSTGARRPSERSRSSFTKIVPRGAAPAQLRHIRFSAGR